MKEQKTKFTYPKNPIVKELVKNCKRRYLPLSKLKGEKGKCKWCMGNLKNNREKYCSVSCRDSAWAFFYPQKYAYQFVSERQEGKCAHCNYAFSEKTKKFYRKEAYSGIVDEFVDMGEVDHVIPIHQGGEILGVENLQLLCKDCHRIKSADERRKSP